MSGPMFSAADKTFNLHLAQRLRGLGFSVYCPNESEPINDKTRSDITAQRIYDFDIAELEQANVLLCQVSEDSGTNWEAGYFDCLSDMSIRSGSEESSGWPVISGCRLRRTRPRPASKSGWLCQCTDCGGMQQSLGIYLDVDAAIERLIECAVNESDSGTSEEDLRTAREILGRSSNNESQTNPALSGYE
ncbi:MAG: nucleoside 2-deoxyribosyltransferase [Thermomicrobiales bacterium]